MESIKKAKLVLENGLEFQGFSFGYEQPACGEVVFSTAMVGYPESLTDPSYSGQILCVTYPIIGNYGVPADEFENGISKYFESDKIQVKALVISDYSFNYSHWNAAKSLDQWLKENQIPGIFGIDTRELTKTIRENGSMMGKIVQEECTAELACVNPNVVNQVDEVSCKEVVKYNEGKGKKVVLLDCGVKNSILRTLIQKDVEFKNLALAVTDEQHRFGVNQRGSLAVKGSKPHTLVMSATPTPRTLSLIIYGDLDLTVIDELPKGRQKISTYAVDSSYHERLYAFIKKHLDKGLQAYIVCPLVEESDVSELTAATEYAKKLKKEHFSSYSVGLLHGKMKDAEGKDITVTLHDCSEPIWVRVSSQEQPNYFANIAPLEKEDQTSLQKFQLPTVRITKAQADAGTITIPVTEIGTQTTLAGLADNKITINLNNLNNIDNDVAFVDMENGRDIEKPTLVIGQKYLMRMRMKDNASNVHIGGNSENCRVGTIYFYLMILPNTVVWTPAEGSYNGWGLDENWRGWNDKDADGVLDDDELMEVGFVPVAGSDVIIPTLPDVTLYPYVHDHNHYPMDVNAHPSICKDVYFAPGAIIHNQHLLQYNRAFVDMTIPKGNWYMMSAPLQKMYSGDMYVPHEGTYEGGRSLEIDDPFATGAFQGERRSTSAYAFWASYYNQSVKTWYQDGGYIESTSSSFQQSNGLNQPLEAGSGFALWGEAADVAAEGNIVIRLPKQETTYSTSSGTNVSVPRDGLSHKLAFTASQDANKVITPMTITLTNKENSEYFIFGNPTMAFINMHDFLHDNEGVLNHTFYRLEGAAWSAETEHTMGDNRYLAPMTSVMLETKDKSKERELNVQLSPLHLTLTDMENPFDEHPEISENPENSETPASIAPRARVSEEGDSERMTIYASTNSAYARTILATTPVANDYYLIGEDALFVSSGIESNSYVTTPLNMYTVAEQIPMMADVRQGISEIPLGMLVADDYRTTHMQLAFYLSSNWTRECYFCDSKTGQKIRIMDGLVITVEMPQNHEQRYYIEGPDEYLGSSEDPQGPTTAVDNTSSSASATLQAFSLAQGELTIGSNQLIQEIRLYDLAGRLILDNPLTLLHTTTTVAAPSGICLVEAVLRDGTTLHTQALVK